MRVKIKKKFENLPRVKKNCKNFENFPTLTKSFQNVSFFFQTLLLSSYDIVKGNYLIKNQN